MIDGSFITDIQILSDKHAFMLALPGLMAGLLMMLVARFAQSEAALPMTMVAIPLSFYIVLYVCGFTLDDARQGQWVGDIQPTSSISSLLKLVDFNLVRWDLVFSSRCLSVWVGMVFVVSFSSCLDVAAISMDMGEPLDVNKELITVGFSNLISGLTFGQTGSYIFSQTILTYRTGHLSRWIGFIGVVMFLSFVVSNVNLLEIAPLFFLGSTLIFIGVDLLYEWIFEVFHKLIPSEYAVLVATFVAIQVVGINGGIVFGVIVAVVEYVVSTSRLSSIRRVSKQSRAVRQPRHRRLLQEVGYDSIQPKIVTLEIRETVFFGSSLQLLSRICDEINISASPTDMIEMSFASPRHFSKSPSTPAATSLISNLKKKRKMNQDQIQSSTNIQEKRKRPNFLILDLSQVPNVDASAARSCFLQLAKMCGKNGIIMIVAGANARVDWVLRSHDAAYSSEDEKVVKGELLYPHRQTARVDSPSGKVLLLDSLDTALQHCENKLLFNLEHRNKASTQHIPPPDVIHHSSMESGHVMKTKLSTIFSRVLGLGHDAERQITLSFEESGFAQVQELELYCGEDLYTKNSTSDSFYIVLAGCIDVCRDENERNGIKYMTNSGRSVDDSNTSLGEIVSYLQVGGIFGYIDFSLGRRRHYNAVCSKDGTILAKITKELMDRLESEDPDLHRIVEKVLLQSSLMELANFDVA